MKSGLQLIFFSWMLILLVSCDQHQDTSDYLQHPEHLLVLVRECQMNPPLTQEEAQKCKAVFYAGKEMATLVTEIQANPQQFGERMLRAQMQYAAQTSEDKTAEAQQTLQKINHYLAVLGLASPE